VPTSEELHPPAVVVRVTNVGAFTWITAGGANRSFAQAARYLIADLSNPNVEVPHGGHAEGGWEDPGRKIDTN
jgi:hypothetical protein